MIECPDCTVNEQYVLEQLQTTAGVTDRTALAVLMGNIQQESRFTPNICEGGQIVPYDQCLRGGYWTWYNGQARIAMMAWACSVLSTLVTHLA